MLPVLSHSSCRCIIHFHSPPQQSLSHSLQSPPHSPLPLISLFYSPSLPVMCFSLVFRYFFPVFSFFTCVTVIRVEEVSVYRRQVEFSTAASFRLSFTSPLTIALVPPLPLVAALSALPFPFSPPAFLSDREAPEQWSAVWCLSIPMIIVRMTNVCPAAFWGEFSLRIRWECRLCRRMVCRRLFNGFYPVSTINRCQKESAESMDTQHYRELGFRMF